MKREPHASDASGNADLERMHRHLLGDLDPAEFHQLEQDLLASPELRGCFLRAVGIDAALQHQALEPEEIVPAPPRRNPWPRLAVAAAIGLAALALWRMFPDGKPATAGLSDPQAEEVATLVDTRDCIWPDTPGPAVGKGLAPGVIRLDSGVALIEFDGGARLALQGPARLELIGPKAARLHRGHATVRCEEGRYSFSLLTPTSTVIDLGTEFGVAVEPDGASEVHVLDGEVEVADTRDKEQRGTLLLNAGETVLLASNGENQMVGDSTRTWVRDYRTRADREARATPPRVIARDTFPVDLTQERRFSLGTGWNGAWWQATTGRKGDFRFTPMEPLAKRDGKSGLAMLVGGWVEVRRTLASPIDPTRSQTIYVGFSLHRMNPNQRDKSGKLSEATVMFRSSKDPATVLGMALSGRNHWVVLEPGGWERSEAPVNGTGPFFVVAKVEFNPRRGNKVSMIGFSNFSSIPAEEPADWELVTRRQLATMKVPLDMIALQVRQSPFKFGEIVLGNSWQAVVGPPSEAK
jgi:ferric-dicitrate binding protein FerR (iron transport regulator)